MGRDAYQRINKYIAKLDPESSQKRYESLKEQMIENVVKKYIELMELDNKVKVILDSHPDIISVQYFYYFSYTKEIWRLVNKYAGIMLYKLVTITENKWEARGLNKDNGKIKDCYFWHYLMSKLKRIVYKNYFSFGYNYPKSTYKYYYQIKKLLEYEGKLKEILKYYYILDAFYKLYQLIKKRRLSELESLIKKELLTKRLKEEVLASK